MTRGIGSNPQLQIVIITATSGSRREHRDKINGGGSYKQQAIRMHKGGCKPFIICRILLLLYGREPPALVVVHDPFHARNQHRLHESVFDRAKTGEGVKRDGVPTRRDGNGIKASPDKRLS